LLNPADVDNPSNDKEAMDFFNNLYSLADLAVIHGLRTIIPPSQYCKYISVGTIIRKEIFRIVNHPKKNIYCLLGGGTVNVGHQFFESTIRIGELCVRVANILPDYKMHIVCSSQNIYDAINENSIPQNVSIYNQVLDSSTYYSDACLIITRSGRNTLSELVYLGIPAISFVSGCSYRKDEQKQNMNCLSNLNIVPASLEITPDDLKELCLNMIERGLANNKFECGNDIALEKILSL
jgi:UDP-N-acetylglucosamine:LPS N-acetylglucosamine transferase